MLLSCFIRKRKEKILQKNDVLWFAFTTAVDRIQCIRCTVSCTQINIYTYIYQNKTWTKNKEKNIPLSFRLRETKNRHSNGILDDFGGSEMRSKTLIMEPWPRLDVQQSLPIHISHTNTQQAASNKSIHYIIAHE